MAAQPPHRWLTVEPLGDVAVVTLTVNQILDLEVIRRIGEQLNRLVEVDDCRAVILNFGHVSRLGSAMVGNVIGLHNRLKVRNGRLVLCRIAPHLFEVFETMGLTRLLEIYPDEQEALQSFEHSDD